MPATIAPPPAAKAPAGTVPPSGGEIHVTPSSSGTDSNPTLPAPSPNSAKGKMFADLRKKAGVAAPAAPAKPNGKGAATEPAARPGVEPPEEPAAPAAAPETPTEPAAPAEGTKPGTQPATAPEGKTGKVSPWKLVDEYKARSAKAEARILELEKSAVPEAKRKEYDDKVTGYEKRIQEMQDDLRYFNAEKYDPDIVKANADYEGAWKRALSELSEISVVDGASGQSRAVNASDILDLVNMPLGKAREIANAAFGDFADDVMTHRKEIKNLFESKSSKLEELRKNGGEREKQRKEQYDRLHGEINGQIKKTWESEHAAVLANEKHGKFFKPRDGDEDWNARLERGFKFVEEALAGNPADPRMTAEQRQLAVRKHVALRNRAAAFEAVRLDYDRLSAKYEAMAKKLEGYEKSTPRAGGTTPPNGVAATGSAFDQFRDKIRALAK